MADDEFPSPQEFLKDARRDFAEFYASATPADAMLLDGLVMASVTLTMGFNSLSRERDPGTRAELERMTVRAEEEFLRLRDDVRDCRTYRSVSPGMQLLIGRVLFEVKVPGV